MPTYNALEDPYLVGFFDKPYVRRHIKEMSLKKHKRKSVSHISSNDGSKHRPSTSGGIGYRLSPGKLRLPNIEVMGAQINNKEEEYPRTAPSSHRRRVMAKSMEKPR